VCLLDHASQPLNKLKIVFVFYQLVTAVPRVYGVLLPPAIIAILETFSIAVSFGLPHFATTPLECLGLAGYLPRLFFWMLLPCVIVLVVVMRALISSICRRRPSTATYEHGVQDAIDLKLSVPVGESKSMRSLFITRALSPLITAMFLLYPIVTNVAFEGFPCFEFAPVGNEDGRGWLRADVEIECRTPEHDRVVACAWLAIAIYPVGMWLLVAWLLFSSKNAIKDEAARRDERKWASITGEKHALPKLRDPFLRAIGLLYRECEL
jgi:hypothetical protein